LLDLLLLRCGHAVGATLALSVEIVAPSLYMIATQEVLPNFCSDLVFFHMYEEIEHSVVTVCQVRPKTSLLGRIASLPLVLFIYVFFLLAGPIITLI